MTRDIQVSRGALILIAVLGMGAFVPAPAQTTPADIRWNELPALIVGHEVTIPVEKGAVAGEVLSVREDALMLDIRRTSDPVRYPKGQTAVPHSAVREIRVLEHHGSGGRILGSVVGVLVGMVAGAEIAAHGTRSEAAAVSTFTGTSVACTVAGYYAGRSADQRWKVLRIVPPR